MLVWYGVVLVLCVLIHDALAMLIVLVIVYCWHVVESIAVGLADSRRDDCVIRDRMAWVRR